MRWMLPLLLVCAAALGWADSDVPYYRTSHALLIGINAYQHVPALSYAAADVRELREVLVRAFGFPAENVVTLTDGQATKAAILSALAAVTDAKRVADQDRVLIFFSGHGQTVKLPTGGEKGFLIPVDAQVDLAGANARSYLESCVPMNLVWENLDLCPAKHVLLIADACYSGLLARAKDLGGAPPDVSTRILAARQARQVLTAGRAGEKAMEKSEWGHGAFTYQLLAELKARAAVPGSVMTARELHATLFRAVTNLTGGRQTPVLADKDTDGEFLFLVPGAPAAPVPPSPPTIAAGGGSERVETTARLQLTTTPAGATVFLGDAEQAQKTPCTLSIELGRDKTRRLEVSLTRAGYVDEVQNVTLERGTVTPLTLTMRLRQQPALPVTPVTSPTPVAPKRGDTRINPHDSAVMVFIPAGAFPMGSADGEADERPVHQVYLDDYFIYQTPVTVAQYRKFCTATGRPMPTAPNWGWQDTHPVVNVSWHDAQAYATWAGGRLPTEAQWEKAARGDDGRTYPWGAIWDAAKCNSSASNLNKTTPVGSYPAGASPYGVLDMAGNVWNWCADWYDGAYYQTSPARNPTGPTTGTSRVLRGGSWYDIEDYTRGAYRSGNLPVLWGNYYGFRCASLSPGP
jgi:sulfatase modifying factor 1